MLNINWLDVLSIWFNLLIFKYICKFNYSPSPVPIKTDSRIIYINQYLYPYKFIQIIIFHVIIKNLMNL